MQRLNFYAIVNFAALIIGTKVGVGMKGMDVDLRQLPAVIGKKRLSTESPESTGAKKSKTEMFDV